jgi:hypothetical protein
VRAVNFSRVEVINSTPGDHSFPRRAILERLFELEVRDFTTASS